MPVPNPVADKPLAAEQARPSEPTLVADDQAPLACFGQSDTPGDAAGQTLRYRTMGMPQDIARTWLDWQCKMLSGTLGGAVFALGREQVSDLAAAAYWPHGEQLPSALKTVAVMALGEPDGLVRTRRCDSEVNTICDVVATPLLIKDDVVGVVAVRLSMRPKPQQKAALQLLRWGAVWLELQLQQASELRQKQSAVLVDLTLRAMRPGPIDVTAAHICSILAEAFSCDRVALGFVQGLRVKLAALSHALRFDRRIKLARDIETAMEESLDQQQALVFPPGNHGKTAVLHAHQELAERHRGATLCTVPLLEDGRILGAMTFARHRDQPFAPDDVELIGAAAGLLGPLLALRRREARSVWAKLWEALKAQVLRVIGRGRVRLKLGLSALVALVACLTLVQVDDRVAAPASVEGTVQQAVVAPQQGFIAEAHVRAGDIVKSGDLMVELDPRELQLEREKWRSERAKYARERQEALATRQRAQISIAAAKIEQAEAQIRLIEGQLQRARLQAPFDGIVVSGDLSQALGAPVERGQLLFEVAPLDDYRVALEVDEHQISRITNGQQGALRLTGLPHQPLPLKVERVIPVASAGDGRNFFRVEAAIDDPNGLIRPGMQGIAKVAVARGRLGWVLLHDLVERLRLWIWSLGW